MGLAIGNHEITVSNSLPMALLYAAFVVVQANAQTSAAAQVSPVVPPQNTSATDPNNSKTYATDQPLAIQSNEGFWGHLNPFARKKWVNRQLNPVRDRLNELDQLSATNARDIKDVDARAQSGIRQAQTTADGASQQAAAANGVAAQAQSTSQQASQRTQQLSGTIANLDQYQEVSETEIRFRPGQTVLNAKAKDALDGIVSDLQSQKGYLIEVKGFASGRGQAGVQTSQRLASSVVRYLVEQHSVPVYRIHLAALGNASYSKASKISYTGNAVYVTLIHNSLAALNSSGSSGSSPIGATQRLSTEPSPRSDASHSSAKQ